MVLRHDTGRSTGSRRFRNWQPAVQHQVSISSGTGGSTSPEAGRVAVQFNMNTVTAGTAERTDRPGHLFLTQSVGQRIPLLVTGFALLLALARISTHRTCGFSVLHASGK